MGTKLPQVPPLHFSKWNLNTMIKNHPIAHVTFLLSFAIQYLLVNLIFEERMFLSFTIDCNNCWWLVKIWGKKAGEDKSKCPEKMVEMSKVLISAQKPLGFLGARTMEWLLSSTVYDAHIKDWRARISLHRSLFTHKFLEFVRDY